MTLKKLSALMELGLEDAAAVFLLKIFEFSAEEIFKFSKNVSIERNLFVWYAMEFLYTNKEILFSTFYRSQRKFFSSRAEPSIVPGNSMFGNNIEGIIEQGFCDGLYRPERNLTLKEEKKAIENYKLTFHGKLDELEYFLGRKLKISEFNLIISNNLATVNSNELQNQEVCMLEMFEFNHLFEYISENEIKGRGVEMIYKKTKDLMKDYKRMIFPYIVLSLLLDRKPVIKKIEESLTA